MSFQIVGAAIENAREAMFDLFEVLGMSSRCLSVDLVVLVAALYLNNSRKYFGSL